MRSRNIFRCLNRNNHSALKIPLRRDFLRQKNMRTVSLMMGIYIDEIKYNAIVMKKFECLVKKIPNQACILLSNRQMLYREMYVCIDLFMPESEC